MVLPYRYGWQASLIGIGLALLILTGFQLSRSEDGLELATMWTGRASALLFLPILAARPLVDLYGPKRWGPLLRQRSGLGQILAGNHHIHMILLTVYLIGEGAPATAWFYNPGLYIYGILIGMHVTSFPTVQRKLSKTLVNRLHWIGLYAIGAAFFETLILSTIMGTESGAFRWSYLVLFFGVLAIRTIAFLKKRKI